MTASSERGASAVSPKAARIIADGIESGKKVVEFPLPMSLVMRAVRFMPNAIYDRALRPFAKRKIDPSKVRR